MCFTISSSVSTELQCDSVCGMCNLLVHWLKTNWVDTVSSASENDLVTHALNGTGCNVHSRKRFCVADEVGFHVRLGPPVWLYLGNLIFFIPLLRGPAPPGGGGGGGGGGGPPRLQHEIFRQRHQRHQSFQHHQRLLHRHLLQHQLFGVQRDLCHRDPFSSCRRPHA